MNKLLVGVFSVVLLSAFVGEQGGQKVLLGNKPFQRGEQIEYRVNFGIFTVGEAVTRIENRIYNVSDRMCYKVDAFGETSGLVSWITKVDDQWGAYLDTTSILPHVSYRKLKEGRYRRDELVTFDRKAQQAIVKVKDQKTGIYGEAKYYETPENVHDVVSGFMYLRVMDFSQIVKGDTITIPGFLEDTSYFLKVIYGGKEVIDSKLGDIRCHILIPIVPNNKLFDGENSITAWISDDKNQIPIKVQAKMFIGSTGIEVKRVSGLVHRLETID